MGFVFSKPMKEAFHDHCQNKRQQETIGPLGKAGLDAGMCAMIKVDKIRPAAICKETGDGRNKTSRKLRMK